MAASAGIIFENHRPDENPSRGENALANLRVVSAIGNHAFDVLFLADHLGTRAPTARLFLRIPGKFLDAKLLTIGIRWMGNDQLGAVMEVIGSFDHLIGVTGDSPLTTLGLGAGFYPSMAGADK